MIKINHSSHFYPDYVAISALELDVTLLRELQVRHIVFDVDNTLVRKRANIVSPDVLNYLISLQSNGFNVYIGSNTSRDLRFITDSSGARLIASRGLRRKPRKIFFRQIVSVTQADPGQIAMVGDHMLNDVFGANRMGFVTILVRQASPAILRRPYMRRVMLRQLA